MCCRQSLLSPEGLLNARGLVDLCLKNKEEKNRRDNLLQPGHVHKVLQQRLIASCYIVCSINQPAFNPSADYIRYWTPLSTLLHYLFRGACLFRCVFVFSSRNLCPLQCIKHTQYRSRSLGVSRFAFHSNVSNYNHNGTYDAPHTAYVTETLYPLHLWRTEWGHFLGGGQLPHITGPKTIPIEVTFFNHNGIQYDQHLGFKRLFIVYG